MRAKLIFSVLMSTYAHASDDYPVARDPEWLASSCRYRSELPDGPYGQIEPGRVVSRFDRCVARAQAGLIYSEQSETDVDKASFHSPARVEFVNPRGERQSCVLYPRAEAFDAFPQALILRLHLDVTNPTPLDPSVRRALDRNIAVECSTPVS